MYMHIYVHVQIKSLKMSGIANCAYVFIVNAGCIHIVIARHTYLNVG